MATPNSNRSSKTNGNHSAQNSPPAAQGGNPKPMNLTVYSVRKMILEPDEETDGHKALFCEGDCQVWIHRVCAGITHLGYDKLGESTIPFLYTVH